jgi:hypothetical protein
MTKVRDSDDLFRKSVDEAKAIVASLAEALPEKLSVASLGVMEKAPFQLLSIREPLIWRTEELSRCALKALEAGDLTVAASLARSVAESVAVVWRLAKIIEKPFVPSQANEDLMNIFGASRTLDNSRYRYQILNLIDQVNKDVPGARSMYDDLSEIAHPNWEGVAGLYSKLNRDGKDEHFHKLRRTQTAILLSTFLQLFEHKYNWISDKLPEWIAGMTPIRPWATGEE